MRSIVQYKNERGATTQTPAQSQLYQTKQMKIKQAQAL